jgi:hypothetical protein
VVFVLVQVPDFVRVEFGFEFSVLFSRAVAERVSDVYFFDGEVSVFRVDGWFCSSFEGFLIDFLCFWPKK